MADLGEGRANRPHEIRNHVEGAAAHGTAAKGLEFLIHLPGSGPIVGGACFVAHFGANVGALFDAGDVVGIGTVVIAAGKFLLVEFDENAHLDGLRGEKLLFRFRAVTPEHAVWLAEFGFAFDPGQEGLVGHIAISETFWVHKRFCLTMRNQTVARRMAK
jgi:hypothetical protein